MPSLIHYRLLPIATTIPPATLSVESIVIPFVVPKTVPSLETNVNRQGWAVRGATSLPWQSGYPNHVWFPTPSVRQIVARAAVQDTIGDIPAFGPNTSYSLTFDGPALECNHATETQQALMYHYKNNMTHFINVTEYDSEWDSSAWLVSLHPVVVSKAMVALHCRIAIS
jgi:hypothetical protein